MSEETASTTDLFEIIKTTLSTRKLKPDPVPNELIRKILAASVYAERRQHAKMAVPGNP